MKLFIVFLILFASFSVSAQEATQELVTDAVIITEVMSTPVFVSDPSPMLFNIAASILIALAGGGSFAAVIMTLSKSRAAQDNTEKLYEALSPVWQTTILGLIDTAERITKVAAESIIIAKKVTDGKPNDDPSS